MIQEIRLENFLFMQKSVLNFSSGLNVITGETGAGKSILLEAVKLLLGKKARSGIVLPGKRTARLQATFSIARLPELKNLLEESDLLDEDNPDELLITRTFKEDGAGKIMVNGMLGTLALLKRIGPYLMEIHGQNEHQTLIVPDVQRKYLDRTGNEAHLADLAELRQTFSKRQKLQQQYLELEERNAHSAERIKELQETLQELQSLGLKNEDEEDELKEELKKLSHSEQIISMLQGALNSLSGLNEQAGAASLCFKAADCLKKISEFDADIEACASRANSIYHELQDLEAELNSIAETTDMDPDKLYDIQARLSELSRTCRKYNCDFKGLFRLQQQINEELADLFEPDSSRQKLRKALDEINEKFAEQLTKISKRRQQLAKALSKTVSKEMEDLGFNSAIFIAALEPTDPTQNGAERVEFCVSLNPGVPEGPLRKIASGGELSRVALAIKKVLACNDDLPTLLFDEIDTGIGGKTAEAVAASLKALADQKQVLLVTHLHQIAKEGHFHFTVNKQVDKELTNVFIQQVVDDKRIEEIARMLGQTNADGLKFAKNLLAKTS
jgi:DNA repair protein RecN (Recombination protein N)